jgi:hypothetical protein
MIQSGRQFVLSMSIASSGAPERLAEIALEQVEAYANGYLPGR